MKKLLSVVLALIMCVSIVAGCANSNIAAKTTDIRALLENTAKELVKERETATKNAYGFIPSEEEGYYEISVAADGMNAPVSNTFTLNSFAAKLAGSSSLKDKEMSAVLDGNINGTDIDLLQVLWGDNSIEVASPSLLDKTFTLPTRNLTAAWNNSVWGSAYPLTEELPSLAFSDYMNVASTAKDIEKEIFDLTVNFLVGANQTNEETSLMLNGANTTVTKFTMVVTKDAFKTYVLSLTDSILKLLNEDIYKNMIISSMGIDEADYEMALAELKSELEYELNNLQFQDVTFYLYGYNAKIVRAEWMGVIDGVDIKLYAQFNNPDVLINDVDVVFEATDSMSGENAKLSLSWDGNMGAATNEMFVNFSIDMEENGYVEEVIKGSANVNYNTNVYSMSIDSEEVGITLSGTCKKGNMLEMTIDDLVVKNGYSTVSVQDMIRTYLGTELNITLKASENAKDIEFIPTSTKMDVFSITEDDITNMQTEITNNLTLLMNRMGISLY